MTMLASPINRSIIWAPAHRYPLGRCGQDARNKLDLRMGMAFQRPAPAGWPPHFIAAMSEYDVEYVYHYLGRRPRLIEATSFGYILRGNRSQDQRREFLIGPLQMRCGSLHDCAPWLVNAHEEAASNLKFGTAKKLYGVYKLNDLRRHRAAIVLPYAVMSFGLTELYALRVPLFAPSRELAAQQQRWLFRHGSICTKPHHGCILRTQITLQQQVLIVEAALCDMTNVIHKRSGAVAAASFAMGL